MIQISSKQNCSGCHACYNVCPIQCISMDEDREGFLYPRVFKDKCMKCSLCEKVCPILQPAILENKPKAYASYNKNENIRMKSSSGGVFTLIAEEVIKNNGVVFGAGFDKNFNVEHSYVETIEELSKFRGSKYVQSNIGNAYKKAKEFLEQGRNVLFTGTPCQIDGLKLYLQKEYNTLICQDIICHGVPSPKAWREYKKFITKGKSIKNIYFRNKRLGWNNFSMRIEMENNIYSKDLNEDIFMKAFLTNFCLRPSCYFCHSKSLHRRSDITLADFWGIEKLLPNINDDKGTSLVFINSEKGMQIFKNISSEVVSCDVDINEAIRYNSSAYKSVELTPKREKFFKYFGTLPFDKLVNKCIKESTYTKVKHFIQRAGLKVKREVFK